jgi:hypothetical protein
MPGLATKIQLFGRGGDEEIRDVAAPLAPGRQEPLDLSSPTNVIGRGVHQLEDRQIGHVLVPLMCVGAAVPDLNVGDTRPAQLTCVRQGLNNSAHCAC